MMDQNAFVRQDVRNKKNVSKYIGGSKMVSCVCVCVCVWRGVCVCMCVCEGYPFPLYGTFYFKFCFKIFRGEYFFFSRCRILR